MSFRDKNKDVFLNFGLIAFGTLREIEKLHAHIEEKCEGLDIVYQTVCAHRLYLKKKGGKWDSKKESEEGCEPREPEGRPS